MESTEGTTTPRGPAHRNGHSTEPAQPVLEARPICLVCGARGVLAHPGCRDFFCHSPGEYDYLRCPTCRLLWVSPQPGPADLVALYQRHYDEKLPSPPLEGTRGGWKTRVRQVVLAGRLGYPSPLPAPVTRVLGGLLDRVPPIAKRVRYGLGITFPPFRPGRRLLDVGAGRGTYVRIMQDNGWLAEGVEANPDSARQGQALYGVTIHPGTLPEQRFLAGSFDAVAIRHVFEHVADPEATLREIRRILRPGGWLGMAMPNGDSLGSRWFGRDWRGLTPPWHLHLFNPRALAALLVRCGFARVRVRTTPQSAHWVYEASRRVRAGTYQSDDVPSTWWFHGLEAAGNAVLGTIGEEMEAVAEAPA